MPAPHIPPTNPPPAPPRPCHHCQYCGVTAEVWDIDGQWCSPEHQRMDRQSETTYWHEAAMGATR